jgi:hypothetical protein
MNIVPDRLGLALPIVATTCFGCCGVDRAVPAAASAASRAIAPSVVRNQPRILLSMTRVELGKVEPGSITEAVVYLTNEEEQPQEIAKIEVGCECVSFKVPGHDVFPGERVAAKVKLDLSREAEFGGELAVEVRAFGPDGTELFSLEVVAMVMVGDARGGRQPTKVTNAQSGVPSERGQSWRQTCQPLHVENQ